MVTREDIVAEARKYLGVRWHHQGRSVAGMDCLGLIVRVAHDLFGFRSDVNDYGRIPDSYRLRTALGEHMNEIPVEAALPADVLLMRFERFPIHVGIATDRGMIHAFAGARKVVEHRLDDQWRSRILSAYQFRGVA